MLQRSVRQRPVQLPVALPQDVRPPPPRGPLRLRGRHQEHQAGPLQGGDISRLCSHVADASSPMPYAILGA